MHSFMADIIPVEFQGLAAIECVQKLLNVPFFSSSTIYSPAQYHNLPLQCNINHCTFQLCTLHVVDLRLSLFSLLGCFVMCAAGLSLIIICLMWNR